MLLSLLFLYGVSSHATELHKYSLALWPKNSSLSQGTIISILSGKNGFLWIATLDGLSRFDGNNLIEFDARKPGEDFIESSNIIEILESGSGGIFVATKDAGLQVYNEDLNAFSSFNPMKNDHLHEANISSAYYDNIGRIWLGYEDGHISRIELRTEKIKHFQVESMSRISSFSETSSHTIFAATEAGEIFQILNQPEVNEVSAIPLNCRSKFSEILTISVINDSEVWIGTRGNGLYSLRIGSPTCSPVALNIAGISHTQGANIYEILNDPKKSLVWIGSDQGLYGVKGKRNIVHFHSGNSPLADNVVSTLSVGENGSYWVGTFNGLNYQVPTVIDVFNVHNDTNLHSIVAIDSSEQQGTWIASYQGLLWFDPKNRSHVALRDYFPNQEFVNDKIMSLHIDSNGMWVGYSSSGLEFYSLKEMKITSYGKGKIRNLSSDSVSAILTTSSGVTLIGTYGGGLNLIFENQSVSLDYYDGSRVIMLYETNDGNIWVGTEVGLYKLNLDSRESVRVDFGSMYSGAKTNPLIWTMAESGNGDIWFGTMHHGLLHLSKQASLIDETRKVSSLSTDIISVKAVYAIQIDDSGYIWCSTNQGLVRIEPDTFMSYVVSRHQGLYATEFDFGASHKDATGHLYFGGSNGYIKFDPDEIELDMTPPQIKLTDIDLPGASRISGTAISKLENLQLTHKNYLVTFTFSVLDFLDPDKNQFRYKLENFDPEWIENGTRNTATYTNLPAGDYVFRVQGANASGVWNREGISLNVKVLPPYWKTWWAYCAYALALLIAGFFVRRVYDSYSIERRAAEMVRVMHEAEERADDDMQEQLEYQDELVKSAYRHNTATLALINDCISCQNDYLPDELAREANENNMRRISSLAMLEDCLYFKNDGLLADLNKYTDILTARLLRSSPVSQESITTINETSKKLFPVELASPLSIVIYELLDNCIQHAFEADSPANYIHIIFNIAADSQEKGSYSLIVRDSGIGIPGNLPLDTPETSGLAIVRAIVKRLSATLHISSEKGTIVSLEIPRQIIESREDATL